MPAVRICSAPHQAMSKAIPLPGKARVAGPFGGYDDFRGGIVELLDAARRAAARSVNAWMTASYREIGRRIVEAEQKGRPARGLRRAADRAPLARPDEPVRPRVQPPEPAADAPVLPDLADSPDSVWRISCTAAARCAMARRRRSCRRSRSMAVGRPGADVTLPWSAYAPAVGQGRQRTPVLRSRGAARRMARAPARPPDRQPVLRAHRALEEQERDAGEGRRPEAGGCGDAR